MLHAWGAALKGFESPNLKKLPSVQSVPFPIVCSSAYQNTKQTTSKKQKSLNKLFLILLCCIYNCVYMCVYIHGNMYYLTERQVEIH